MKIAVLVKPVPDTYGARKLALDTGLAERPIDGVVIDEIDERALEVALSYSDSHSETEIVVLSMAPGYLTPVLRKALAIGGDSAVQIVDDDLVGADFGLTAEVLAVAIRRIGADLVISGNVSTDGAGGVIPAMIAELLGMPHLSSLSEVHIDDSFVRGRRTSEDAVATVRADLPAVISVTETLPEARFPNFKSILAAKKKLVEMWSLAEIGFVIDPNAARSIVLSVESRSRRSSGLRIEGTPDAGNELVRFLTSRGLVGEVQR